MAVNSSARRLEGKVAIVTGGASGIGECAVRTFHKNGAKVIIADIQDKVGKKIANELGDDAKYIHCNVSNEDDVRSLVDTAVSIYGKLDIMYSNAGVIDHPVPQRSILEVTKSDIDKVINVNLMGSFWAAKHAARVMIPNKKGCILFTGSATTCIAGLSTHPYAASKYGVLGLMKNLAAEVGEHGIRVNCVSPSGVPTGIYGGPMNPLIEERICQIFSSLGNLKKSVLKANDVAMAVLFLASDEANYVSGLNLTVDGGFSVVNPTIINSYKHGLLGLLSHFFKLFNNLKSFSKYLGF